MTVTTPLGQVLSDEDGTRLEFVRSYDDPVEDVWSALTDPERVARWFGTWTGDPATGSVDLVFVEAEGAPHAVTILTCRPPTRLVIDLPSPEGMWRMSVRLSSRDGGCTLVLTQQLALPYDASSIGPGWHYYLDRLGAVVAGTAVPGPEDWEDYFPALKDAYSSIIEDPAPRR